MFPGSHPVVTDLVTSSRRRFPSSFFQHQHLFSSYSQIIEILIDRVFESIFSAMTATGVSLLKFVGTVSLGLLTVRALLLYSDLGIK